MNRDLLHALAGAAVALAVSVAFDVLTERRGVVRNFMGETLEDQLYRRLNACEESIRNLWEAHNARDASDG